MRVLLVLALQAAQVGAAAPLLPDDCHTATTTTSIAAEQAARTAQHLRADATVAAALKSVGVGGKYEEGEDPTDEPSAAAEQAPSSPPPRRTSSAPT
eukprot:SAG22_NODE_9901_length_564_cov_0.952688_1_plen_96_part_01